VESFRLGEVIAGRYVLKHPQVVLDTQPGILPAAPEEISTELEPYLRLIPFQLHLPQIYSVLRLSNQSDGEVLLLEHVPFDPQRVGTGQAKNVQAVLLPKLTSLWQQSIGFRQLNWLWQIAQLWQPFSQEEVASTLLTPDLIRVEASLMRVLELKSDQGTTPTLGDLGNLWQQWVATADPQIADLLEHLCQGMQQGQVRTAEQLVMILDQAIAASSQTQVRHVQLATQTEQGPTRQRNEDACYPPSGSFMEINKGDDSSVENFGNKRTLLRLSSTSLPLVIVCDGIGGHEGGDVASNLAISTIQQELQALPQPLSQLDPIQLTTELEQATLAANDVLKERNDSEQRQERQRMGTTLVMALIHDHELFVTHVGDSRAYRITRTGCHQVTLDDDLAAREVRLGYSLYREALQQPGSGSLVQALGMNSSSLLYPTVQRFLLDEDCLFLLCSDGLSDNDLVEQHWQTELLPFLDGKIDIGVASQRLVALANVQNGHDNVTVGLIHCQVQPGSDHKAIAPLSPSLISLPALPTETTAEPASNPDSFPPNPPRRSSLIGLLSLLFAMILAGLGGCLAYLLLPEVKSQINVWLNLESPATLKALPSLPSPELSATPLSVGSLIQVDRIAHQEVSSPILPVLFNQPEGLNRSTPIGRIPVGAIVQITSRQTLPNQITWLRLKVCSLPRSTTTTVPSAIAGSSGWIEETELSPYIAQNLGLPQRQLGQCIPMGKVQEQSIPLGEVQEQNTPVESTPTGEVKQQTLN
jgi:serine/threonine protein phosphatase PrpC